MSEPSAPTGREPAEWCPSETEIATVIAAGARERYAYFLRRVCETRQIWGLHSDGWAILSQGGRRLFPL